MTEDFVKQSLKNYEEVLERVENVFNLIEIKQYSHEHVSHIDFNEHSKDNEVYVTTSRTCWNESVEEFYKFPIRYLWMDNDDILIEIHKKKKEEEERIHRLNEKFRLEAEKKEKEEYERLKKKYGN